MFKKVQLSNGLRLVYERIPYVRSVSVGIWVGTGSRNETSENNGISHFIEHMLFKGTSKRSAKDVAECIDAIGGQINALPVKNVHVIIQKHWILILILPWMCWLTCFLTHHLPVMILT